MNFKNYYNLSLEQISEEIEKDNKVALNITPLFESPMHHEADFFSNLNDIKTNNPFALEIIKNGKFIESISVNNAKYKLYRNKEKDWTWDFFISGDRGHELISAFVKYTIKDKFMVIGGLWQIEWVVGLVKELLIKYYPTKWSGLESGAVANNKGKKFYQNLAKSYIQQGKIVTVTLNNKEIPYKIKDAESYWKGSDGISNFDKKIKFYF